jgi:hypothetical protein
MVKIKGLKLKSADEFEVLLKSLVDNHPRLSGECYFQLCSCGCDCHSCKRNWKCSNHTGIKHGFGELDGSKSRNLRCVVGNKQVFQSSRSPQLNIGICCNCAKVGIRFLN